MRDYVVKKFESKELNREVDVFVSVPDNYNETDKQYPVLYMHDGQIIFNIPGNPGYEETGIMDFYLNDNSYPDVILVGISSTDNRNNELIPFEVKLRNGSTIGGMADIYLDFIVDQVIPYVNQEYRTIKDAKETGLLGVSLGGVCAIYAATKYSDYFSLFASVSGAFPPVMNTLPELLEKTSFDNVKKMYLDVGTKESEREEGCKAYLDSNNKVNSVMKEKLAKDSYNFSVINDSGHLVKDWQIRFPKIIEFLFSK
jgi:predicted alpha/beta superfamily hydrolase